MDLQYNTKTSTSPTLNTTSKKRLKASSKARKKKATKASSRGPAEDAEAVDE